MLGFFFYLKSNSLPRVCYVTPCILRRKCALSINSSPRFMNKSATNPCVIGRSPEAHYLAQCNQRYNCT